MDYKPTYFYEFDYDFKTGEFLGYVFNRDGISVFSIDDTEEMRDLITSGEMEHIDDVIGLEKLLKHEKIINEGDYIALGRFL